MTDAGLLHLAGLAVTTQVQGLAAPGPSTPLPPTFHRQLTSLAVNHTAATGGLSTLLQLRACCRMRSLDPAHSR